MVSIFIQRWLVYIEFIYQIVDLLLSKFVPV